MTRTFVFGTRGSRLALRQVELVQDALRAAGVDAAIEVREIKTDGDISAAPLSLIGGLGVFTKAIEDALLDRTIDIAVHSLKDLPPALTSGLMLAAIPARADARDALVTTDGRPLSELKQGARIGTGSERRSTQLNVLRRDIVAEEIRGNVDTRVRKVESGEYDGAVLAMAGLLRLGLELKAAHVFSPDEMLPAVGQAALGIEIRADDAEALALLRPIDDHNTNVAVTAERAFLARMGAGCRMPVAAFAAVQDGVITMRARTSTGTPPRTIDLAAAAEEPNAIALGEQLADEMMSRAAGDSMDVGG